MIRRTQHIVVWSFNRQKLRTICQKMLIKKHFFCFKVVENILFQSLQYILAHYLLDSFKVFFSQLYIVNNKIKNLKTKQSKS